MKRSEASCDGILDRRFRRDRRRPCRYLASRFQADRELERRRRAIATALLADPATLETHIADAYHHVDSDSLKRLPPASVLGRFSDYVDVLSGEATHALSVVNATLESLLSRYAELRKTHGRDIGSKGIVIMDYPDQWAIEFVTAGALIAIDLAHRLLIADGGAPPETSPIEWVTHPHVPELPPRVNALIEQRWFPKQRKDLPARGERKSPPSK